ncbi:MAG: FKBP-type peptidyl-prolyl cis-trans isomerase [Burkholderiales bacterium]
MMLAPSPDSSAGFAPAAPRVQAHSFLTLHYRLSGPAGDIINTFSGQPATLTLGSGALSAALEQHLLGLAEGAQLAVDLPAGSAFGARNNDMVQWVARSLLAQFGDPQDSYQVGDVVHFPVPGGPQSYAGAVVQTQGDAGKESILFDFNHPLAGQPVRFEAHVIGVL